MGKCWIFEETGEKKIPLRGDWIIVEDEIQRNIEVPYQVEYNCGDDPDDIEPILKLTEYPSNPLGPIREVADRKETDSEKRLLFAVSNPKLSKNVSEDFVKILTEIKIYREAIQECMAIVEGK